MEAGERKRKKKEERKLICEIIVSNEVINTMLVGLVSYFLCPVC